VKISRFACLTRGTPTPTPTRSHHLLQVFFTSLLTLWQQRARKIAIHYAEKNEVLKKTSNIANEYGNHSANITKRHLVPNP